MKKRLDVLLTERGICESRSKATAMIMAGVVFVEDAREDKPGSMFNETVQINVKGNPNPYVSRGGLKLKKAIDEFGIKLDGMICADIGASTGGFTDCMLKEGAKKVYSIDVGYGQLDYRLRSNPNVIVMERTNVRDIKSGDLEDAPNFVSIDVSFISLKKVLPVIKNVIASDAKIVTLIKPQFEAGKEEVGKNGVVRDKKTHLDVVKQIVDFCEESGLCVNGLTYSPVKGPKGNIEYLLYLTTCREDFKSFSEKTIDTVVESSHETLKGK